MEKIRVQKHVRDQLPGILISGDRAKIPADPEIDPIKVPTKSYKNDPIGKKKGDRGPWKIL